MQVKPHALLIDLDGTLYPSTLGMEKQIIPCLRSAVATALGKSLEEAIPIVQALNHKYGYCVRGLEAEYGIDASEVVIATYRQIDRSSISPNERLANALSQVGQLIPITILTNSSREHAVDVLARIGVSNTVKQILGIEDVAFYLKPENEVYLAAGRAIGVPFREILYFDDSIRNLHAAWMMGVSCVLVGNGLADPPLFWENHLRIKHYAPDHIESTHNLPEFLEELARRFS